jgi:hypothetical protein
MEATALIIIATITSVILTILTILTIKTPRKEDDASRSIRKPMATGSPGYSGWLLAHTPAPARSRMAGMVGLRTKMYTGKCSDI